MTPIENGVSTPTIKEDNEIAEMDNIIGINEDKPKGENETIMPVERNGNGTLQIASGSAGACLPRQKRRRR